MTVMKASVRYTAIGSLTPDSIFERRSDTFVECHTGTIEQREHRRRVGRPDDGTEQHGRGPVQADKNYTREQENQQEREPDTGACPFTSMGL